MKQIEFSGELLWNAAVYYRALFLMNQLELNDQSNKIVIWADVDRNCNTFFISPSMYNGAKTHEE